MNTSITLWHFQRNQKVLTAVLLLFVLFGFLAAISLFVSQRIPIREQIQQEAQQEVTYISSLVKQAYLKNNYVAAAEILEVWAETNQSVVTAVLQTSNGFKLVNYRRPDTSIHSFEVIREVREKNKLLFSVRAEKDITFLEHKFSHTKSRIIIGVILFLSLFGAILWFVLKRIAFLPMQRAMEDQKIEADSRTRKLSRAVEQTDDSVVITNPDGLVEYVNPAFERMTGYTKEDAIGAKMSILRSGVMIDRFMICYGRLF